MHLKNVLIIVVILVGGCTNISPIKNLSLPPVTTIEGSITKLDVDGFVLTDSTGSIFVKAKLDNDKVLNITVDEKVKVYGNLEGGQERIFDGYVIRKMTGEQIIVTNPTPHFGFIIQGRFNDVYPSGS